MGRRVRPHEPAPLRAPSPCWRPNLHSQNPSPRPELSAALGVHRLSRAGRESARNRGSGERGSSRSRIVNLVRVLRDKGHEHREHAVNYSLLSADRNTHLKIVSLALTAAIAVVVIGITARVTDGTSATTRIETAAPVLKAGKPTTYTGAESPAVR